MDLNQKILAALLAAFFLIALIRIFSAPLRLAVRLLGNTLLGFVALWAVNMTAGITGLVGALVHTSKLAAVSGKETRISVKACGRPLKLQQGQ